MKNKLLIFSICIFTAVSMFSQRADNYPPNNIGVSLAGGTALPVVVINVNKQMIMRDSRINGDIYIVNNDNGALNYPDTITHPNQRFEYKGRVGLKYRGNTSFTASDKKPYSVRTQNASDKKQAVSIFGLGANTDWVMLAPYADKSMIRDLLIFGLARGNFEFVPSLRLCELVLDGTYYGVYLFGERVRPGEKRFELEKTGESGDKLTGGYLVEINRIEADEPVYYSSQYPCQYNDGQTYTYHPIYQYKEPAWDDPISPAQKEFIDNRIHEMESSFLQPDYTDPVTGYRKYIHVQSFVNYMIFQELARNIDGYRLSTPMYKYRDSKDGGLFRLALWDFNISLGNANYGGGIDYNYWSYNVNESGGGGQGLPFWWAKMMQDSTYVRELKETYTSHRNSSMSDTRINAIIDSLTTLIKTSGAEARNTSAWPRWGIPVWPNPYNPMNYDAEIILLKTFINNRLAFMDANWLLTNEPLNTERYYQFVNCASAKYLAWNESDKTLTTTDNPSDNRTKFVIAHQRSNNVYTIRPHSSNYLLAKSSSTALNAPLSATPVENPITSFEEWIFEKNTLGYYKIITESQTTHLLRHRTTDGDNRIGTYRNRDNEYDKQWRLVTAEPVSIKQVVQSNISISSTRGDLSIRGVKSGDRVMIYNMEGVQLRKLIASNDGYMHVTGLAQGIHAIRIESGADVFSTKTLVK